MVAVKALVVVVLCGLIAIESDPEVEEEIVKTPAAFKVWLTPISVLVPVEVHVGLLPAAALA